MTQTLPAGVPLAEGDYQIVHCGTCSVLSISEKDYGSIIGSASRNSKYQKWNVTPVRRNNQHVDNLYTIYTRGFIGGALGVMADIRGVKHLNRHSGNEAPTFQIIPLPGLNKYQITLPGDSEGVVGLYKEAGYEGEPVVHPAPGDQCWAFVRVW